MLPLSVERRLLGLAVQRHGADDFSRRRRQSRSRCELLPVERENALGLRIVNDRIGIVARWS